MDKNKKKYIHNKENIVFPFDFKQMNNMIENYHDRKDD